METRLKLLTKSVYWPILEEPEKSVEFGLSISAEFLEVLGYEDLIGWNNPLNLSRL